MSQKFAIHKQLRDEDLASFDSLCAKPGKTYDDLQEWLGEHGYKISRGAVYNYRNNIEETLQHVRDAATIGRAIKESAEAGGRGDIAEGVSIQALTAIQSKFIEMQQSGECDSGEVLKLAAALHSSTASRLDNVKLKASLADLQKKLADLEAANKAAVKEAEKAAAAGGSAAKVIDTLKRAMGIVKEAA